MKPDITVTTTQELVAACAAEEGKVIRVAASLRGLPAITLRPNVELRGGNTDAALHFVDAQASLRLTTGNKPAGLSLFAQDRARVIRNDPAYGSLGHMNRTKFLDALDFRFDL